MKRIPEKVTQTGHAGAWGGVVGIVGGGAVGWWWPWILSMRKILNIEIDETVLSQFAIRACSYCCV